MQNRTNTEHIPAHRIQYIFDHKRSSLVNTTTHRQSPHMHRRDQWSAEYKDCDTDDNEILDCKGDTTPDFRQDSRRVNLFSMSFVYTSSFRRHYHYPSFGRHCSYTFSHHVPCRSDQISREGIGGGCSNSECETCRMDE